MFDVAIRDSGGCVVKKWAHLAGNCVPFDQHTLGG
jgi:hypothetical protein